VATLLEDVCKNVTQVLSHLTSTVRFLFIVTLLTSPRASAVGLMNYNTT